MWQYFSSLSSVIPDTSFSLLFFSLTIFLPDSAFSPEPKSKTIYKSKPGSAGNLEKASSRAVRRNSYEPSMFTPREETRRSNAGEYRGYLLAVDDRRKKLPVVLQFHGGGWVSGSNDSVANDMFCRRIAKLYDAVVVAVGYRLAPENRFPVAFEDGVKVLNWLAKQANLAECSKSLGGRKFVD